MLNKKIKHQKNTKEWKNWMKALLGEDDPSNTPEKLTDWQTSLKALDKDLDTTIITDNFKNEWEKITHFKQKANLEALLKKVIDTTDPAKPKVNDSFLNILKKTDSKTAGTKINNLKVLMGEEPKKVITLIKKFELVDSKSDSGITDKDKPKTQNLRRLAVLAGKKSTDTNKELTTAELDDILYKIGIGEKTFSTAKFYNADLTEITTPQDNGDNKQNQDPGTPWYLWGFGAIWWGSALVILGTLAIIYWKQLVEWWNGPAEEIDSGSSEPEETE